jgi:hypothetical protein
MKTMDARWFDLNDFAKSPYSRMGWVPILGMRENVTDTLEEPGYTEQFEGVVALLFPKGMEGAARRADWNDVWGRFPTRGGASDTTYYPPLSVELRGESHAGELLVGMVDGGTGRLSQWDLNQDLVLALQLVRIDDKWVRPEEEDVVVARVMRDDKGEPHWLEMRVEHLRDYLAARSAGVLIASFVSRRARRHDAIDLGWDSDTTRHVRDGDWKGFFRPMSEMPVLARSDAGGYYVDARLRRNEWLNAGPSSPRVRGDRETVRVDYIVEPDGTRASADDLLERHSIRPLFFRPTLGREILVHPNGLLRWDTRDTGDLGFEPYGYCRFSLNDLGLISLIAVDVAGLPVALQQRFAAHNVTPDGGISDEAHRMWFEAEWVESVAPETRLEKALSIIDQEPPDWLGGSLFRDHPARADILAKCDRFRAVDVDGFHILAKDVCRVVIDDLNLELLNRHTSGLPGETRSLKRLESILTNRGAEGRTIMGPLFAVYELRQDDAHLPSADRQIALKNLGVDESVPWIVNGARLLDRVADTLETMHEVFQQSNGSQT